MSDIIIFEAEAQPVEVRLEGESVWLTQKQMADLFDKNVRTVSERIRSTFREGELVEDAVIRSFRITAADGKTYDTAHYNLDVIISVGYRVKSQRGVRFRQWATRVLRDHLTQGYSINEHRLALDENGLTALMLLIAESDPKAKDLMVRLVMDLLAVGADTKKNEDA